MFATLVRRAMRRSFTLAAIVVAVCSSFACTPRDDAADLAKPLIDSATEERLLAEGSEDGDEDSPNGDGTSQNVGGTPQEETRPWTSGPFDSMQSVLRSLDETSQKVDEAPQDGVRTWTTTPFDGLQAEAIVWDAERLFLRIQPSGDYRRLSVADLSPEDRAWLDTRPQPSFDAPTERWTPSEEAANYPGSPTAPFDGSPIAFNGRAVIFLLPGGKLPESWTDFAALSSDSRRRVLERLSATIDDRTKILAASRTGQGLWVDDDPEQARQRIDIHPRMYYREDDRAVAYDGTRAILLLRRPPGIEGKLSRPTFAITLTDQPNVFQLLGQTLRERFIVDGRPTPGVDLAPEIAAAYERAGRSEPPKVGERRSWSSGALLAGKGPVQGRLLFAMCKCCVIVDDAGRLDVTNGMTQEDCDYVNAQTGFHPIDATEEERAPCKPTERGEPLNIRAYRMTAGKVDAQFVRDLDDALSTMRRSAPFDHSQTEAYVEWMNTLTDELLQADWQARNSEAVTLRVAVSNGEMTQADADAKMAEIAEGINDPGDGSNESEKFIEFWKKELPDSSFPWTLEANALKGVAWTARGSGFASEVKPEAWPVFERFIARADAAIREAAKRAPDDFYLRDSQMGIALGAGYDLDEIREVFRAGLDGNRLHYAAVLETMIFTLLPRWYGRPGDLARLAEEMRDEYGDLEGALILNSIISAEMRYEDARMNAAEYPPEMLASAARVLIAQPDIRWVDYARIEAFAFLGGDWKLAWHLKRATLRELDPKLVSDREAEWPDDWSIREFYRECDGPPDAQRVLRIDFLDRGAPLPEAAFADANRLCLIRSQEGGWQAIDLLAMQPDETFVAPRRLLGVRYLPGASDRWLAATARGDAGAKRLVRIDSKAESEPVTMQDDEPFPTAIAISRTGDRIVGGRAKPQGSVTFWDASTGDVQGSVTAPFAVRQALFAPDGERVAIWDGESKVAFVDANSREMGPTIELPGTCDHPQFVEGGKLAFLTRSGAPTKPRWSAVVVDADAGNAEELSSSWEGEFAAFGDVAFSGDLSCVFVTDDREATDPDDRILALDPKTGETIAALDGHFGTPSRLKYCEDVQRLYSVGADRHLIEWDVSPKGLEAAKKTDER